MPPLRCKAGRYIIDGDPLQILQLRRMGQQAVPTLKEVTCSQRNLCLRILDNGLNSGQRAVRSGWVGGDGNSTRVQAPKKSFDEMQARREKQERTLSSCQAA